MFEDYNENRRRICEVIECGYMVAGSEVVQVCDAVIWNVVIFGGGGGSPLFFSK